MGSHASGDSALARIAPEPGSLTLGVEFPLDNDWSPAGRAQAAARGRPYGVPDLTHHHELAQAADRLGFSALWLRDVPLWDPAFGDAGQVFDPFPYLGYLAAATERIQLGTAAVALPLRHPLHVAKMAATIDRLSHGRLILGIASGDRPVEYPLLGLDFARRGEAVRESVESMRAAWAEAAEPDPAGSRGLRVLPAPVQSDIPLVMAGHGQQSVQWLAENLGGHFTYHRPASLMRTVAEEWKQACGGAHRPLLTTMLVDLADDRGAAVRPIRFGARLGRDALIDYLDGLRTAGVGHVALNFRPSARPVSEVLQEIAEHVLPHFTARVSGPVAPAR
ncbi:LLM class oxidoreductase [Streptomyces sp. NPDC002018]|uniref:LLM class oxidoreductase n=1 Tax=Streptomyces sp. NPDC002018 TaxID=3364629 RepID=UPI0036A5C7AA